MPASPSPSYRHSRQDITDAVVEQLSSLECVRALFEAGSAATGRKDEWSDIDFIAVAEDDAVPQVFAAIEQALSGFGISLRWRVPEPTWHGHSQCFYKLNETSPFLLVDFVVMKKSAKERFRERERHGTPIVYFDKEQLIQPTSIDRNGWKERIAARRAELAVSFPMFQPFVAKELYRQNHIDAFAFYMNQTIRPLVEVLRMRYCPDRYDFGMRYLRHDLPGDLAKQVEKLVYVSSPDDLLANQEKAIALFNEHVAAETSVSGS